MTRSRSFRFVAALIALIGMLFMQLAVAAYVCPGTNTESGKAMTAMAMTGMDEAGMASCDGMDQEQASLCHAHAHDQTAKQSLDKSELPPVQPFAPVALVRELATIEDMARPLALPVDSPLLARTAAPPLSIRNCCFRI